MKINIDIDALVSLIKNFDYSMLSDTEWDELKIIDVSDESQLFKIIDHVIVPEYESMDSGSKKMIKDALNGALSFREFDFSNVLSRVEMPFAPLQEPRLLFLLIWKAIFKESFVK